MSLTTLAEALRNREVASCGDVLLAAAPGERAALEGAAAALAAAGLGAGGAIPLDDAARAALAARTGGVAVDARQSPAGLVLALHPDPAPEGAAGRAAVAAALDALGPRALAPFEQRRFRDALGQFATGVTVVTAWTAEGRPIGVTANSFTSVSMEPPLVLWSMNNRSSRFPAFVAADRFAIHILGRGQDVLSNRFASSPFEPFDHVAWTAEPDAAPRLTEAAACLQCRRHEAHVGGDHTILIGRVTDLDFDPDADPLIFHRGRYASVAAD